MKVRTRIAPSPTGHLHVGHIRTSLYNYAFAKKYGGQFILRIEDTDRERYIEGAEEKLYDLHNYLGLVPDESPVKGGPFSPYVQSQNLDEYKKHALKLVEDGHAYYCFCDENRLRDLKEQQKKEGLQSTKYDKHCLGLSDEDVRKKLKNNDPYVIRLNIPKNVNITWNDLVYGKITVNSDELDDQVLIKSDGFPTYHLAVVVDDHKMEITHIIRGNDWIPSTPKHVLLYQYFGWEHPLFVHLPNLKEVDGTKKLSKRFGPVAVEDFLKEGYLPDALLNHMMFLGWNPGTEKEIYSIKDFIEDFSLEKIQKTDLVSFDRDKLDWFNGRYIRSCSSDELLTIILEWSQKWDIRINLSGAKYDTDVLNLIKDRLRKLSELDELASYFYSVPSPDKELFLQYADSLEKIREILSNFCAEYKNIDEKSWKSDYLDSLSHELLARYNYKPKEAFMTVRIAVTGSKATPPLFDVLALLGKKEVVRRFEEILKSKI